MEGQAAPPTLGIRPILGSDQSCHLRAGLEHSRHMHTVHEPNMLGRMLAPLGGRLQHRTRSPKALRASSHPLGHHRVAVQRELLSALRRKRAGGSLAVAVAASLFAARVLLFSPEQTLCVICRYNGSPLVSHARRRLRFASAHWPQKELGGWRRRASAPRKRAGRPEEARAHLVKARQYT